MNKIKKIQLIIFILFMLSLYAGFLYTLSMLTEVTQLNFFTDFLDESVLVYVDQAQQVNQLLFDLSLWIVVPASILYAFKIGKKPLCFKKTVVAVVLGVMSLVLHGISYLVMVDLNQLYATTDTSWPEGFPNLFGYVEPANHYVGAGPTIYLWIMMVAVIYILTFALTGWMTKKENTHEKTE